MCYSDDERIRRWSETLGGTGIARDFAHCMARLDDANKTDRAVVIQDMDRIATQLYAAIKKRRAA